ncbi:protein FAM83H isoform X1 [Phyllopteryx taeniolatus]|uniref:protein FAM83H isoform X1 n=2 Tax=Phyllopteryx taeniolatus TaxID=161469 RepID=UPI002AD3F1AC|nr:protein FAM83H isoform X1 [Phyllopteryx taeniolatus]
MARRSQCSSAGDNPLHPNYLPPHYREEYRLAIDALIEEALEGYYEFLQKADVVAFLSTPEIQYIQGSVHVPQRSTYQEQTFLESGGDSSSDTYWPIHSDLDAPGLDLGWPQPHLFGGPTEVTTLVNPPEPDMPSIKEQARRLIKNAQQVIAIVMDMFTDVDIFADILNAAMRNVVVYILLDEQNAHNFMNMVSNCRVNLQSIQFLRVRTVSGITYHCRSGKSFKGQMMDRFLLTDCRAVLSGNYSFMWSFEKLHRCMAHLFLGQLVSTFDEEFRILFAQSQPLLTDVPVAKEDIGLLQKRQYPSKITSLVYREPKKLVPMDMSHTEDWTKPSYDEQMETDWKMSHLKRNESLHGPVDMYSRFPSQQSGMEQQGHSKFPMMESPALKRHIYSEGVHGRYNYPFPTQPTADFEARGRMFHRGQQQNMGPGPEVDYKGPEKFWSQNYHSADQYLEPGVPQEIEPFDNFDPVLNYLSSTTNVDFEQVPGPADLPLSLSQATMDDKQFFQEPNTDRKDPMVKRGLRNWRINSYLSACDNPGDEGLPLIQPQASDPFEELSNPVQPTAPVRDFSIPKIPNVREFKIPAIPRVSQLPSYAKAFALEPQESNKLPEESTAVTAATKTTPTPSESSSTTEGEKSEDAEQKEPNTAVRKDESFRRKYNAAMPRSSRLRSSLIFNSLDQHTAGQQDEESDKNESEQTKLPFVSQVFGQRRSAARESFGWTRYLNSSTFDSSVPEASKQEGNNKPEDKDSSKEDSKTSHENLEVQETLKLPDIEQQNVSPSPSRLKRSESDLAKTDQSTKSLVNNPLSVDMSDPDQRLMFFKDLAAKRKAAKAAEAEKRTEKTLIKTPTDLDSVTVEKEDSIPNDGRKGDTTSQMSISLSSSVIKQDLSKTKSTELPVDVSDEANKQEGKVSNLTVISQRSKSEQPRASSDLKKVELGNSQTAASSSVSAETEALQCDSEDTELHKPALSECSSGQQPILTKETHANLPSLKQDKSVSLLLKSTSNESTLFIPDLGDSASSTASTMVTSNIRNQDSSQFMTNVESLPLESHSSKVAQPDSKSSNSEHPLSISNHQTTSSPHDSNINSPSIQFLTCDKIHQGESVSASTLRSTQSTEEKSSFMQREAESSQDQAASVSVSMPPEINPSLCDSAYEQSGVFHENCASGSESSSSSLQPTPKTNTEKSCSFSCDSQKVSALENSSGTTPVVDKTRLSPIVVPSSFRQDIPTHSLSSSPLEFNIFGLKSHSKSDKKEAHIPKPTLDLSQEPLRQTNSASEPDRAGSSTPAGSDLCSTVLVQSGLPSHTERAEGIMPALHWSSGRSSLINGNPTDINKVTTHPTSIVTSVMADKDLNADHSEACSSKLAAPLDSNSTGYQNYVSEDSKLLMPFENKTEDSETTIPVNKSTGQQSVCSERINESAGQNKCSGVTAEEVVPSSQQSKQPKSSQSRYHSSTVGVLSSSNLRDDTKLLLEQISANSQSRNESTKESPVTDDEKEDGADKNAKRGKERELSQDRDKLLEKLQSMRKERKVYSRFDMAP